MIDILICIVALSILAIIKNDKKYGGRIDNTNTRPTYTYSIPRCVKRRCKRGF